MSTTTIRLPDELKARVAVAAANSGNTAHNFMLLAVAEKTAQVELSKEFDELAERRYANIVATGKTIPWSEMRSYLEDRAAGKEKVKAVRPTPKKLAR
jgi:predicted transcriptional regulator